ncbi:WD40-repeat-containing domain protein [Xylogone sp. PMI_703]|nr:WD40-repeat-containing domain protein [Xylogone sp. PMI_703]
MSSFFTLPSAQKKRKRANVGDAPKKRLASSAKTAPKPSKPAPKRPPRDESISGSEDESEDDDHRRIEDEEYGEDTSGSEEEEETAAERRLRLAERYLENVREEVDEVGFDAEQIDRDLIAERLKEDVAESKGRMYRKLAEELDFETSTRCLFRNNTETITSIATCPPYAYTVSKDFCLTKWQIQDLPSQQFPQKKRNKKNRRPPPPPRRKPAPLAFVRGDRRKANDSGYQGHTDIILTVAASQDGKYVVTGGSDRKIIVWDTSNLKPLRVFTHHRDAVTGLAFRRGTNQLYSASKDRTVKTWSLDELAYVETLFGHQDEVVDVAALAQERCISVGARDRTARLWKIVDETQLVFRGGGGDKRSRGGPSKALEGSIDRVAMIDEEMFVTGGDNGTLALWTVQKKKPIFTVPICHGIEEPLKPEDVSADAHPDPAIVPTPQPRWITALATIPYSDIILTGSWDGFVRVWKVSGDKKRIEANGVNGSHSYQLVNGSEPSSKDGEAIVKGVVNDISVFERGDRGKDGVCVVAAVGKEHRLGRWYKFQSAKNGAVVFEVPRISKQGKNTATNEEDEE